MLRRFMPLTFLLCAVACGSEPETPATGPDHRLIHQVERHDFGYTDVAYGLDTPTLFRTTDVLPGLDVRALLVTGDAVFAGTASGLFRLAGEAFERVGTSTQSVVDLALVEGRLAVATVDRVAIVDDAGVVQARWSVESSSVAIHAVAAAGQDMFVATDQGLFAATRSSTNAFSRINAIATGPARDIVVSSQVVWIATATGVARYDASTDRALPMLAAPDRLADDDVRALAVAEDGQTIIAGTAEGIAKIGSDGGASEIIRSRVGGLPTDDVRAVTARGGRVFVAHGIGASFEEAQASGQWAHYHSLRWIPAEQVTDVALGPDGVRWIATPAGVTRIDVRETTLSERASAFERLLDERHWRMDGFVDDRISYADEWNLVNPRTGDHDNDGLWTEMQIGTWCFAYSVTKDEQFYQRARRAMDVMLLQIDIPGATFAANGMKPGFITRSLVRDDEGEVFTSKATMDNWHLQSYEGRDYYWKDDTSSDEYVGHFWGIPIFYDLCAKTDGEKQVIADHMRLVMDYLIAGDYQLIDLDGQPTLHGHWENLAAGLIGDTCLDKFTLDECLSSLGGGGWLNGMEILGHLLATWHMTGDDKYLSEYERLATDERYFELVPVTEATATVSQPAIANHSDHELAMLAYYTLYRYEPSARRRALIEQSILDFYAYEREEHNPWQVATIASMHSADVDIEGAIRTLQDMPSDWRTWRYDNSHRKDARRGPPDRHGDPQFTRVFPYDEIRTMKWNGSPYVVAGGSSGRGVLAPTPYLIAYWMLRFHGVLQLP